MQGCVGHGPQVDPETELVVRQILGQGHVWPAVGATSLFAFCPKEPVCLAPHVDAFDSLVVNPVWDAVDCYMHFGDVWILVVFRVLCAQSVEGGE